MLYFADLHLHSKYSRAVSFNNTIEGLAQGAKLKGLQILGTGDFTHPAWFSELKKKLKPSQHEGLFEAQGMLWMLTTEVATFLSTPKGVKKVHHVLHAPSLEIVSQINDVLAKKGNLAADGRPMFGNTSPAELVERVSEISNDAFVIPAHAWTPWFGVFGSMSGFNSLGEAYEEQSKRIFAIETGMSSDPAMNRRLSSLDKISLVSNSDSHSPHPWRLGRECNAFDFDQKDLSYESIFNAIRERSKHFAFTVEVNPSYGKYHYDGHRACNFPSAPDETKKIAGVCPVCKKPLTIGVLNRVEQLADRPDGFRPDGAIDFKTVLPLHELLAVFYGMRLESKQVAETATKILSTAPELKILLETPEAQLAKIVDERIAKLILRNREGKIQVTPGYDGEYGIPLLEEKEEKQKRLGEY
ncbi:MAG: endonuclease Q family protein [Candidatus Micrarchaeota archaeon]